MTAEEWLSLKVGDVVHDVVCGRDRVVLEVNRCQVSRGVKFERTRTTIVVESLKTRGARVIIFDIMDGRGGRYRKGRMEQCATT